MKNQIFITLLAAGVFSSCTKDTDIFTPANTVSADTVWVSAVTDASPVSALKATLAKPPAKDSIDAGAGATYATQEGLTVVIPPQSLLLSSGQVATGKIYVETMLIKKKGDMVLMDKPATSSGRMLINSAHIFVKAKKENEELTLAPGKTIYIRYTDNNPSSLVKVFHGDESNRERFNWTPSNDIITYSQNSTFEISGSALKWLSTNYFADTTGTRVNVQASLPLDYTNANTSVYLVFKEIRSVVGMYGDAFSKKFSSIKVPSGKTAMVISITKKGNNSYYLGHETITTGQTLNNGHHVVPLSPRPTSLSDIKAFLNTL